MLYGADFFGDNNPSDSIRLTISVVFIYTEQFAFEMKITSQSQKKKTQ